MLETFVTKRFVLVTFVVVALLAVSVVKLALATVIVCVLETKVRFGVVVTTPPLSVYRTRPAGCCDSVRPPDSTIVAMVTEANAEIDAIMFAHVIFFVAGTPLGSSTMGTRSSVETEVAAVSSLIFLSGILIEV